MNKKNPAPTPTPWKASRRDWKGEESPHKIYISGDHYVDHGDDEDEDGEPIEVATAVCIVEGNATSRGVTEANARLIVRAVNLHDRLVSVLERMLPYFGDITDEGPHGEGWKSPKLKALIRDAELATKAAKEYE